MAYGGTIAYTVYIQDEEDSHPTYTFTEAKQMTTIKEIKADIATVLGVEEVNSAYMRQWHANTVGDRNLRSKESWVEMYELLVDKDTIEAMQEQGYVDIPVTDTDSRQQLDELNDDIESIKEEIEIRKQAIARVQRQIRLQQAIDILKEDESPYETACRLTDTVYEPAQSIHPTVFTVPMPAEPDEDPQIDESEEFLLFTVVVFMVVLTVMSIGFIPTLLCGVITRWHTQIHHGGKLAYHIGKELRKNAHDIINLCTVA